jgi:hypothetical protein
MSAARKALGVTGAEVRAGIEQAEHDALTASLELGEALVVARALPDRDTSPEQAAVEAARQRLEHLRAMLPVVEKAEAEALETARTTLDADRRKLLARAMRELLKQAIHFAAAYANSASAFRRMCKAGADAELLLSDAQRRTGNGFFQIKLSPNGLKAMAEAEINRVGLLPAHDSGQNVSAPGADRRHVAANFINAPHLLPSLEGEIRRLTALLLPAPAEGAESAEAQRLPQVAEIAKGHPAASSAAPAGQPNAEEIAQ